MDEDSGLNPPAPQGVKSSILLPIANFMLNYILILVGLKGTDLEQLGVTTQVLGVAAYLPLAIIVYIFVLWLTN